MIMGYTRKSDMYAMKAVNQMEETKLKSHILLQKAHQFKEQHGVQGLHRV